MGFVRNLIFPPKCVGCGEKFNIFANDYEEGTVYCPNCRSEWEKTKLMPCPSCKRASIDCDCVPPTLKEISAISLIKFGRCYNSDRLIYALKRRNNSAIFDFAADELSRRLKTYIREFKLDTNELVLTHVPRKPSSVSTYGFDHAQRLAKGVSDRLGIELVYALKRKRGGKDQKKLTVKERIINSKERFVFVDESESSVKDQIVILVDDVITSGATALACIEKLMEHGPKSVIVLSIAKSNVKTKAKK